MGQIPSSPNMSIVSEYINFLLSAGRTNSKFISLRINEELYQLINHAASSLGISRSKLIKLAIIKLLSELNFINNVELKATVKTKTTIDRKKSLLNKIRSNSKREKLNYIKSEYKEIKRMFTRVSRKLSNRYRDFNVLKEASITYERTNNLLKILESFIKKYDINEHEYNELDKITDDLIDICDTLSSYYRFYNGG